MCTDTCVNVDNLYTRVFISLVCEVKTVPGMCSYIINELYDFF